MKLSFEPVHHHMVKSHTGYVWEPVSKDSSPEAAAECDKLVQEGCMVICHATTPPGVGKWPWQKARTERSDASRLSLASLGVVAIPLALALNVVVIVPALAIWGISKYSKARRPRVQAA
jgi:hypothetical protein